MASYSLATVLGTLGSDPAVKYTPGNTAVVEFSVAVNRQWKDKNTGDRKEEVSWIPIVAWGRTAEVIGEYLHKGSQAMFVGELIEDRWTDKESGQKRSKLKLNCDKMVMLGGKQGGGESRPQSEKPSPSSAGDDEYTTDGEIIPF